MSVVISPSFAFRTLVHLVQSPAKLSRGRVSSAANQTGVFFPSIVSYSENDVNGTRHRLSGPSQRFQWALPTFRPSPEACRHASWWRPSRPSETKACPSAPL
jgi:hypothetical protein